MEQKTSKVNHLTANGSWDSPKYGTFYRFEIGFENGDTGEYSSKSKEQTKFVMGQSATYTIESKEHNGKTYHTIKPAEQQQSGGGYQPRAKDPETDKRITRMSVLKVASDLVVNGEIKLHDITKVAIILEHYIMTGDDSMSKIYAQQQKEIPVNQIENDDLPF